MLFALRRQSPSTTIMKSRELMLHLFQRFVWLDEQLQDRIRARGWPGVSRSQSMILLHIAAGVVRPSDIARRMGVSRQAVHTTIAQLSDMDIVRLKTDPEDGRHKYLVLTETGSRMRDDAQEAMDAITGSVGDSIGVDAFDQMMTALSANWTIR